MLTHKDQTLKNYVVCSAETSNYLHPQSTLESFTSQLIWQILHGFLPPQLISPKTLQIMKFFHIREKTNMRNVSKQPTSNNYNMKHYTFHITSHLAPRLYSVYFVFAHYCGEMFLKLFSKNSKAEPYIFKPYINIITAQIFERLQEWEVYIFWQFVFKKKNYKRC